MNTEPIFLLGAARSGTTLLRYAIDAHPRIAVPPEWNFTHSLVRAYGQFAAMSVEPGADATDQPFGRIGIDRSSAEVRSRFRSWMECWYLEYAQRRGKTRWGATTHTLLDWAVEVVDDLFDGDAVYVVQLRHPLDQVTSAVEKFDGAEYTAANVQRQLQYWVRVVSNHLDAEARLGQRCTRIRYESFVADPQATLDHVFEFLGEDRVAGIHRKMFAEPHDGHWGDHKILRTSAVQTSSVGRWKSTPDPALVEQALEAVPRAAELMAQLGYGVD